MKEVDYSASVEFLSSFFGPSTLQAVANFIASNLSITGDFLMTLDQLAGITGIWN